jgi:transposase InsO family protein
MSSRKAIVQNTYREYQQAGKKGRGEILDRLVPVTGMNRDYLATVLGRYGKDRPAEEGRATGKRKSRPEGKRGGRPPKYGTEFVKVLTAIWYDHGRPCGKLLVPMIRAMIGFLGADGGYGITAELRKLLEEVSPAEADLLLAGVRKKLEIRGVSTTRAAQTPLRSQIPVRIGFTRETMKPGFCACDTVARCGGSASGQFCKTLTVTDVFSGRVEERALLNAADRRVCEAFSDIAGGLPFPLKGAHYGNGREFISGPLPDGRLARHIEPARTRPYHKNDNGYAEQKNFDAAGKTVGHFRFDTPAAYAALAEAYRFLCPRYNDRHPSFKLVSKAQQADGRYKKGYEKKPRTPRERLMEPPDISEESKAALRRRRARYHPVELKRKLNEAAEKLLKLNREKGCLGNPPGQGGGGQAPAA